MTIAVFVWLGFMSFVLAMARKQVPAMVYALLWFVAVIWSFWFGFNL